MSGLTDAQLDDLVERAENFMEEPWDKGVGRPKELDLRDALIVTCGYMRNNITQEVWAEIFGVSQSCISRYIKYLTPIACDATEEFRPTPEDAEEATRGAIALVDGTLWPCWSWAGAKDLWSGKHKTTGHGSLVITNYDGDIIFVSDPVTGNLETRVNIDSIQSMDLESSRFSAENGRGSAGVLDLKTKMGDDHWRFGGTNFVPGISTDNGLHVNKWTPRLELSGPLAKGRAWFHNGFDGYYYADVVRQLPRDQNLTHGFNSTNLSRFQVNLTPANILTGSFLYNLASINRNGLTFLNPAETTTNHNQTMYLSSVRDQAYFPSGALLDLGFADTRGMLRDIPQGNALYEVTPSGTRGNYFVNLDRHWYRQQGIANLFLPALHLGGTHQLKFGVDLEREAFHEAVLRHDYEVLRDDNSVARYVQFVGSPFLARKNFEAAEYVQDRWTPREGVLVELGLRAEWNEIVRDQQVAPRFSAVWAPGFLKNTKFSAGWGIYYDAISLGLVTRQQDQVSLSTFYPPGGGPVGPLTTSFLLNDHALKPPSYRSTSAAVEHKLPFDFYAKAAYVHRAGVRGLVFEPMDPQAIQAESGTVVYALRNTRQDRYDAFEISLRHTFAGQYEWFAGYTRSRARSNAAVDYSLENPIFAPQLPGPFGWDAPNRFLSSGYLPVYFKKWAISYLADWRTGFPFSVVDPSNRVVGPVNSHRYPSNFDLNIHVERRFDFFGYRFAVRVGANNVTDHSNATAVNNVVGAPNYMHFYGLEGRHVVVRIRLFGRVK